MNRRVIEYDQSCELATFQGPGGFTQQHISQNDTFAIAQALGVEFVCRASGGRVYVNQDPERTT